ncbi:hypothetical protein HRbin02_01021 [Candidatus Calditenuaceae archaeon HR02]|nr:hypothetical protein HRbin02_01021 [Candidatus Calditenuaceae archaeon HR02]
MLEELFEKAVRLKAKLEEFKRTDGAGTVKEILDRARACYIEYSPKPRRAGILAIDSGWNYRLYTGFYIYAMKAAAVDEAVNTYQSVTDVDMLSGDPYDAALSPDLFLKYQAEIHEHSIAYNVSEEEDPDLVLVDGSLIARLADISKRISKSLQTEYMAYVKPLMGNDKLAFVSKYSHDKSLFGGVLGDVYYINHATKGVGYTAPHVIEREDYKFSIFYVRLSEHSNALHIEVPAVVEEDSVKWFIDVLRERSIAGYPYALRLAHKTANLPDQLMDLICKTAGLTGWVEAREVLEE